MFAQRTELGFHNAASKALSAVQNQTFAPLPASEQRSGDGLPNQVGQSV